jgi:hypothetical protein
MGGSGFDMHMLWSMLHLLSREQTQYTGSAGLAFVMHDSYGWRCLLVHVFIAAVLPPVWTPDSRRAYVEA